MIERGVTLLEVAVAILLLSVGALALASSLATALRARDHAVSIALATLAAEGWLEEWRAHPWPDAPASGAVELAWGARGGVLEWSSAPLGTCLVEVEVAVGAGTRKEARVALATRRFRESEDVC